MFEKLDKCPVCQKGSFENFLICADHTVTHESFAIVNCNNCGLKFTNPRPDQNHLNKYYQSENYISHSNKNNSLINLAYKFSRIFTINKKIKLIKKISKKGKLLDFGCGTGEFLKQCRTDGWEIAGVEPAETARKQANTITDTTIFKSIFDIETEKEYELITLWHVLEHIPDLKKTLKKLKKLLNSKGKILIAVPNYRSFDANKYREFWAGYDVPRHLYHFDKNSFKSLLDENKLILQKIIPMKLDAYYVSLLSEKNKNNNYFKAIINGFKSNRWAKQNNDNYSSLIYIVTNAKKTKS